MSAKSKNVGYISSWGYALGCAVGWGAFVMPANLFLPQAGPMGALLGVFFATAVIGLIGTSITYMAKRFPDDAGVHVYVGRVMGMDHAFLSAWAMVLAYLSIMWANATAIVLLIRNILGDVLQWGFYYQVADYDVYFGEILVTSLVLIVFGLLAIYGRTAVRFLHLIFALLQVVLVVVVFIGVLVGGNHTAPGTFGFAETEVSHAAEVFNISMLGPWMFVGFEAVTYVLGFGGRSTKGLEKVMAGALFAGFLAYVLPALIPVLSLPEGYSEWTQYLADARSSDGVFGLPVFYSAYAAMGETGLILIIVAVVSAIFSSLFGLYRATGRLLARMAEDELLPEVFTRKNKNDQPYVSIIAVMILSLIIPFFGRTAIGWIVDVTTISATIVYVYAAACCHKMAMEDKTSPIGIKIVSNFGVFFAGLSFLFLLIPNILSENKLATESYLILAIWSIVGLIYYWVVFKNDRKNLYGKSTAMWLMMMFLIFFSSIMWIRQRSFERLAVVIRNDPFLSGFLSANGAIQLLFVVVALTIMFSLFSTMISREKVLDKKVIESEAKNAAKTAFLSNMSHDIRTPMNAILGFTDLALLDPGNEEQVREYLKKIKSSGEHLLSLINDVLEMSRIESGKIDIHPAPVNLRTMFFDLDSIMRSQAEAKGQILVVDSSGLRDENVIADRLRLDQVLLNLASNAIKYTQEGGSIRIEVIEAPETVDNKARYELRVKDNGMGMTPEFAEKVFEAFERDKDAELKGIQGTGLGMAITKRIIDLMGGTIRVETALGEGSEFIVELTLDIASEEDIAAAKESEFDIKEVDFDGKRVLLVDDVEINREIAVALLEMLGLLVEEAVDGQEAYEKVLKSAPGYYDAVLMDIQMPRMNGYEAAGAIRSISDKNKAGVPIIAMTANAFEEDIKNAKNAGMNGHVAKPIDQEALVTELGKVLK